MSITRITLTVLLAAQLLIGATFDIGPRNATDAACPADAVVHQVLPRQADDVPAIFASDVEALLLIDRNSGVSLVERGADELRIVASTVKMLTALTVLQHAGLDEPVRISRTAASTFGAGIGVRAGEEYPVGVLLEGMMTRSGNDAALALAEHVAGSRESFAELMRAEAQRLGITGAVIDDPSGLADSNRFSARQLAIIADAVLDEPTLKAAVAKKSFALGTRPALPNRNLLINRYPEATGIKTGFTTRAGNALVASAERDGRELIAVVLGAGNDPARFVRAEQLLDYGFTRTFAGNVHTKLSWLNINGMTSWQMPATAVIADTAAVTLTWSLPVTPYDPLDVALFFGPERQCRWLTMPKNDVADQPVSVGDLARRVVAHGYGAALFAETSGTVRVSAQGERS
ncbi:MAG: serine hydrolase [Nitriliruptoraceae bacterium]